MAVLGFGANIGVAANSMARWDDGTSAALPPAVPSAVIAAPRAGVLRNLRVARTVAPGAGNSNVYTVFVNAVVTAITATIANPATSATDLVNTVVVAGGDLVEIRVTVGAGAPANDVTRLDMELA